MQSLHQYLVKIFCFISFYDIHYLPPLPSYTTQGIKFGVNDLLFLMKADLIDHDFICHSLFQELFKRVIPHQCLGAVWSRRDKSRDRDAATVAATIEQFNAVSYRVISTVLMPTEAKPQHRAKVITKWIDIAQVSISSSPSFKVCDYIAAS